MDFGLWAAVKAVSLASLGMLLLLLLFSRTQSLDSLRQENCRLAGEDRIAVEGGLGIGATVVPNPTPPARGIEYRDSGLMRASMPITTTTPSPARYACVASVLSGTPHPTPDNWSVGTPWPVAVGVPTPYPIDLDIGDTERVVVVTEGGESQLVAVNKHTGETSWVVHSEGLGFLNSGLVGRIAALVPPYYILFYILAFVSLIIAEIYGIRED